MAKKKAAQPVKKKLVVSFGLLHVEKTELGLFLLPQARMEGSDKTILSLMVAELDKLYAGNVGSAAIAREILDADKEGRVLWGWSPSRAGSECITWEQWDEFCLRWLEVNPANEIRTRSYAQGKTDSVNTLCLEVEALVASKKLKLVSSYPFSFNSKRKAMASGE